MEPPRDGRRALCVRAGAAILRDLTVVPLNERPWRYAVLDRRSQIAALVPRILDAAEVAARWAGAKPDEVDIVEC
jgi:hypothetical protein